MAKQAITTTTIDGRFVAAADARISVFDNSLLYAEGLFETLLVVDDRIVFLDEHLDRLENRAEMIGLDLPMSTGLLRTWMNKIVKAHPGHIRKLRLTITAGESARWTGRQGKSRVILSVARHCLPERPFRLLVASFHVDQDSVFRRVKTISYALNAASFRQAMQQKYDDALLINERNQIAEVTSANFFWIEKGRIFTPPLSSGCLEGVTRRVLVREASKIGVTVKEKNCPLDRLRTADEVFISSSLKLVVGVSEIRHGKNVFRFPAGDTSRLVSDYFCRLAGV